MKRVHNMGERQHIGSIVDRLGQLKWQKILRRPKTLISKIWLIAGIAVMTFLSGLGHPNRLLRSNTSLIVFSLFDIFPYCQRVSQQISCCWKFVFNPRRVRPIPGIHTDTDTRYRYIDIGMSKYIGIGMNMWKNIGIGSEWSRYRYRLISAYIGLYRYDIG